MESEEYRYRQKIERFWENEAGNGRQREERKEGRRVNQEIVGLRVFVCGAHAQNCGWEASSSREAVG